MALTHGKAYSNAPMHDRNGNMRMLPGWRIEKRKNDRIGRELPYAVQDTTLRRAEKNEQLLWSSDSGNKKIMLTVDDLKQQPHPLPVQSKIDIRKIRLSKGKSKARTRFRPYPCYEYHTILNRLKGRKCKLIDDPSRAEHTLEIAYPLFKLMKVEKVALDLIPEEAACAIKKPKHQQDN
ncbi:hypothetical protein LTR37_012660 [Vermiconidia calcicola]|uniref:Uncharacterized protein n=1 Tax=Vermiconidia calcicola TaxID=1690605 RepID=A0ACC3MYR6_9PEZI|nr:hypothetical protein LTR37_012660 [Vermiconidia calcicola]